MEENATSGAPPTVPASPGSADIANMIERWWEDHFPGSPVAQVTQAWNHAFTAKEDLKRRVADLSQGGQ
ncbi:MAG TPA: hypothetical protein VHY35_08715 [Stellaceae bacterium]|jgi:hypothetical protein|nr:hypothetical protein [Stellaceae bacterium]